MTMNHEHFEQIVDKLEKFFKPTIHEAEDVNLTNHDRENVADVHKWYQFLDSLRVKLSEHKIQKHVMKNSYLYSEICRRSVVNQSNLQQFIHTVEDLNVTNHEYVIDKLISELQFKELNDVLYFALKSGVNTKCMGTYKLIKGNYISMKKIKNNDYLKNDCNYSEEQKPGSIAIFALDKIFIDDDIEHFGESITFISPKWEIVGNRTINLSGLHGDYNPRNTTLTPYENKCKIPGSNGKQGKPGGPGGIFFGIGEQFINGQNLKIIANGGTGGTGQHGCPGKAGLGGSDAKLSSFPGDSCSKQVENTRLIGKFRCETSPCDCGYNYFNGYPVRKSRCDFKFLGLEGSKGENGGDGGKGGKGGNPGFIELFELNGNSAISKLREFGNNGKDGLGGDGGTGGKHGGNLHVECNPADFTFIRLLTEKNNTQAPPGSAGKAGIVLGSKKPREVNPIYNPSDIISEYKVFLRENLLNYVGSSTLITFLKRLDYNEKVGKIYHLFGLFDELIKLEKQYHEMNVGVGYVPLYHSLLDRIQEFSSHLKHLKLDKNEFYQYKKSLNYLFTLVSKKINSLKDNLGSSLITDIEGYLGTLKKTIEELKNYQQEKNKADIIDKKRKDDRIIINEKIKEASNLIENEINVKIKKINENIDADIRKLIQDVEKKIKRNEDKQEELELEKIQLGEKLNLKAMFDVIEFTSEALKYFGPVGNIAGSIIEGTSGLVKDLVLDEGAISAFGMGIAEQTPSFINHIQEGQNIVSDEMKNKIEQFKKYLSDLSQEISEKKVKYADEILEKISDVEEELNEIDTNHYNVKKIEQLENQFYQEYQKIKNRISIVSFSDEPEPEGEKSFYLNLLEEGYRLSPGVMKLVESYKNNELAYKAITDAIKKNLAKGKELKKYEEKIQSTISPTIEKMEDEIHNIQVKLGSQSKVALDVTKWQVQEKLKVVQAEVKKMTGGYKMAENFVKSVNDLDAAMSTLITVYEHIQDYQQQQALVDYIGSVNSVQANRISIIDPVVGEAVNQLETLTRSNLILENYRSAISTFKQFVFPFAHLYLKQIDLPESLVLADYSEDKMHQVMDEINGIIENLQRYKNFHSINGNSIGIGEFDSRGESMKPFFVWKNENYKRKISDLLSGKEVMLTADIARSEVNNDAVKFKSLALEFKTKNNAKQYELNDLLKSFRIVMVNSGYSQYRYANNTYVFPMEKYSLWYNIETNSNGQPKSKNREYDEIKKGNYILSPFTKWKVSLIKLPNIRNVTFQSLQKYENEINLELSGNASFVIRDDDSISSELHLEKYYKTVDPRVNDDDVETIVKESLIKKISETYQELETKKETGLKGAIAENKQNNWFTWKLPNFKILPGADAFSIEEINLLNQNQPEHNYFNEFIKHIKEDENLSQGQITETQLKENHSVSFYSENPVIKFFSSVFSYFSNNAKTTKNMASSQTVSSDRTDLKTLNLGEKISQSPSNLLQINSSNDTSNTQDLAFNLCLSNHNLTFANLIIGKLFGPNQVLNVCNYLPPDTEKNIKINELTIDILPHLKIDTSIFENKDGFINNYNQSNQWYQDMFGIEMRDVLSIINK